MNLSSELVWSNELMCICGSQLMSEFQSIFLQIAIDDRSGVHDENMREISGSTPDAHVI